MEFLKNSSIHRNLLAKKEWERKLVGFKLIHKNNYLSRENLFIYDLQILIALFFKVLSYYEKIL